MPRCPDELSFCPIKQDILGYSLQSLKKDCIAAVTVALLSLPQALAYACVVGLPPASGIVATVLGTMIAALIGYSRHLVIGPNNATVLLLQTATADILYRYYPLLDDQDKMVVAVEIMAALTVIIGLTQILAAAFRLGKIVQFVSLSVIVGYILGSAVAIAVDQLFTITGIRPPADPYSLYEKMTCFFRYVHKAHWITLGVGVTTILLIHFLKRVCRFIPVSIAAIALVTLAVTLFNIEQIEDFRGKTLQLLGAQGVKLGMKEELMIMMQPPLFEIRILGTLLPVAFAIAFVGMLETYSIAKSLAANSGQEVNPRQDLLALGCSNFLMSLCGALPCSGSISRSALNYESGARTRFAAFLSGVVVWCLAWFFSPLLQYVPLACLSALLLSTCLKMVDRKQLIICMKTTKSDALVLVVTFLSCIFLSLQTALYIGIMLSIVLYLRKAASPRVIEYIYDPQAYELRAVPRTARGQKRDIRIIDVEGELFFGAVDLFQYTLREIAEDDSSTQVLILRLKHVRDLDASAALALKQLHDFLRKSGRHLIVASFPKHVFDVLEKSGLTRLLGSQNLIPFDETAPYSSVEKALKRAEEILYPLSEDTVDTTVAEDDLLPLTLEMGPPALQEQGQISK